MKPASLQNVSVLLLERGCGDRGVVFMGFSERLGDALLKQSRQWRHGPLYGASLLPKRFGMEAGKQLFFWPGCAACGSLVP